MNTKIYNKLILLFLSVCSFLLIFNFSAVWAGSTDLLSANSTTLNLYSDIFGEEKTISIDANDPGAVGEDVRGILSNLFSIIFTISGTLMVLLIAIHGMKMIYAELSGNIPGLVDARKHLTDIALGAVILLLSWVFLNFIDPDLLRPRFFTTITQLRTLQDSSGAAITSDLEIPKDGITFNEDSDILMITECPIVEKRLEELADGIAKDKRGDVALFYMVLYSRADDNSSVFYRGSSGEDIPFNDGVSKDIRDVSCTRKDGGYKIDGEKPMKFDNSVKSIVVFPVLSVEGSVFEEYDEGNFKSKEEIFRYWRGSPWVVRLKKLDIEAIRAALFTDFSNCGERNIFKYRDASDDRNDRYKTKEAFKFRVTGFDQWDDNLGSPVKTTLGTLGGSKIDPIVEVILEQRCESSNRGGCYRRVEFSSVADVGEKDVDVNLFFGKDVKKICVDIRIPVTPYGGSKNFDTTPVQLDGRCFDIQFKEDATSNHYGTVTCSE